MTLYEKAIAVACEEMNHQMTLENCKKCWSKWQSFQKDYRFIRAKDDRKKLLNK